MGNSSTYTYTKVSATNFGIQEHHTWASTAQWYSPQEIRRPEFYDWPGCLYSTKLLCWILAACILQEWKRAQLHYHCTQINDGTRKLTLKECVKEGLKWLLILCQILACLTSIYTQGFWYFTEKKKFRGIFKGKFAEKLADFAGFSREKSQNSRKNRPISRDIYGRKSKFAEKLANFAGF